ncbi:uncharacterized protein LOC129574699 [Sitodiplosis mosellana]|uniref:uncharacterized protein LOC129574699 n=1 Tax=Sitodiplosis mosellana TaxID=263140 RepID=UPI002443C2FF|nr:uncharacterized protein LOC129574699 [Sitodiplosis mosellana]
MALKFVTTICVLLVMIECSNLVAAATKYPYESHSIHLRAKRGSPDFLGKIKSSITSSIGKASASSAGASSGTSSSKAFAHEKPVEKEVYFDGWELKKNILNTLFQAVKAITGGVTAIKGQLIKGSGYALSSGGKLIAASGDAVTGVGKKIALSAKLLPPDASKHKYFASSGPAGIPHEDYTSFGHDELVEYAQPHEITGYAPEPPIPYLPVDVAYDNHYPVPQAHAQYGPPPLIDTPHSHITNYISTDRKEQDQHYVKHDGTSSVPGLETDNELTTFDANQKAIEALQLLLRKLPNKLAVKDNAIQTIDDDNFIPDTKLTPQHITQYNIPKDPYIPNFKPIKSSVTSTYTFQLGPLEQITQDTYGGSDHGHNGLHQSATPPPPYLIQKTVVSPELQRHLVPPPSIESVSTTFNSHSSSPPLLSQTPHIDAQPLDLYHTMTLKHVNDNHSNHPPVQSLPYLPPRKRSNKPNPHQFEIQKSIEYQLH